MSGVVCGCVGVSCIGRSRLILKRDFPREESTRQGPVGVPEIAVVWIFKCCLTAGLPLPQANEVDEPVGGAPAVLEWWRLARYLQIGGWPDLALQIKARSKINQEVKLNDLRPVFANKTRRK